MKIYGLPHCSTTKKALAYLWNKNHPATIIDYRLHPLTLAELTTYFQQSGQPMTAWLNTSGQAYRDQKDTIQGQPDAVILQQMAKEPMLIKRPLLVSPKVVYAGFRESVYDAL
jgi:arsenate reductase